MKTVIARPLDEFGDEWTVTCPYCYAEYDCSGFFDSTDEYKCDCGKKFLAEKIEFEDGSYIK